MTFPLAPTDFAKPIKKEPMPQPTSITVIPSVKFLTGHLVGVALI
jgi:hypothetical protein